MAITLKAIMYTDGGFNQDRGDGSVSGFGTHGYTYIDDKPKRGTGNAKAVPTNEGYEGPLDTRGKVVEGERVTVVEYIDIIGGARDLKSSGHSELCSMIEALKWLDGREDIIDVKLFCDNMLVVEGINKYVENWKKKDWTRQDGSKVKYTPEWQLCDSLIEKLKTRMEVSVRWVKGHNGNLGNETSDVLATRGKILVNSRDKDEDIPVNIKQREAQGYWNRKVNVPRILQAPRWYFDSLERDYIDEEGFNSYYVGTHGTKDKEPELPGKPYSDNFLGVIKTKEDNIVLNTFRDYALNHKNSRYGRIVVAHMDQILSTNSYSDLQEYGLDYHRKSTREIRVENADRNTMMAEMNPQGQGHRMMDMWKSLKRKLDSIYVNSSDYQVTDITDQLYEAQGKKDKLKLKAKWSVQVRHFDFNVKVNLKLGSETPAPFEKKVRIVFGQDILSRNQLSALAEEIVSVAIVTWRESDQVARYGTYVVMANGDHGLWARYDANLILCN